MYILSSSNLIGTFCIVNEFIVSCGKIGSKKFNRNILYCKFLPQNYWTLVTLNLIGTFCIVNRNQILIYLYNYNNLIGTFCIVNSHPLFFIFISSFNLIGTFCIVKETDKYGNMFLSGL